MIELLHPWDQQPQDVVAPDFTAPFAERLLALLPLGVDHRDLISGSKLTFGTGASIAETDRGRALRGSGSAAVASLPLDLSAHFIITVSFWLWWDGYLNDDDLAMEFTANAGSNPGFYINPNSGAPASGRFSVGVTRGGSGIYLRSIARPTSAAWHHYVFGLYSSSPSVAGSVSGAWVDRVPQTLTDDALTGSTGSSNFANSTLHLLSRNNASLFGAGRLQNLVIRSGWPTQELVDWEFNNPWGLYEGRRIVLPPASTVATPKSASASLQAIVQASRSATASVEAAVRAPASASASLDLAVRSTATAQASLNAAVRSAQGVTSALEAAVRATAGTAADVSAAVRTAQAAASSLDVAARVARLELAAVEAAVRAPASVSSAVSAAVRAEAAATASMNANVLAETAAQIGLDVAVRRPEGASTGVGAAVVQMQGAAALLGAAVQEAQAAASSVNAYVQAGTLLGAALTAAVLAQQGVASSVQAAVQDARAAAADLNAAVAVRRSLDAAADAAVHVSRSAAAGLSAYVQTSGGTADPADVWNHVLANGKTPAEMLTELYRIHGLEAGLPLTVGATSRQAGPIEQSVSEAGGSVTVTRQP